MSIKITDHAGRDILITNPGDYKPNARARDNPIVILAFGSGTSVKGHVYVATWTSSYDKALEDGAEALHERGLTGVFMDKDAIKERYNTAKAANPKGGRASWDAESTADLVYTEYGYIEQTDLHDAGKMAEATYAAIANASGTYHRAITRHGPR